MFCLAEIRARGAGSPLPQPVSAGNAALLPPRGVGAGPSFSRMVSGVTGWAERRGALGRRSKVDAVAAPRQPGPGAAGAAGRHVGVRPLDRTRRAAGSEGPDRGRRRRGREVHRLHAAGIMRARLCGCISWSVIQPGTGPLLSDKGRAAGTGRGAIDTLVGRFPRLPGPTRRWLRHRAHCAHTRPRARSLVRGCTTLSRALALVPSPLRTRDITRRASLVSLKENVPHDPSTWTGRRLSGAAARRSERDRPPGG